ncbi:hypothetical protein DEJ05_08285 [Curtobacterium sp. MCLR17_045]|nr:hypothetical protein DEJ05_08285 [Curtobacterium sp. MCLR17_045]
MDQAGASMPSGWSSGGSGATAATTNALKSSPVSARPRHRSPLSALRSPLSALRSPLSALRSPLSALRHTHTRYEEPSRRVTSTCTARSVEASTTARSCTRISTNRSHTSTVSPGAPTTNPGPISSGVSVTGAGLVKSSLIAARDTSVPCLRFLPMWP